MKRCANCTHRWFVHGKACCGKQGVTQRTVEDARAPGGDCGPDARHYLEIPEE